MAKTLHLELNGRRWRYVRYVNGKSVRISLKTTDLEIAAAKAKELDREYDARAAETFGERMARWPRQRAAETWNLIQEPDPKDPDYAIGVLRQTPLAVEDDWLTDLSEGYAQHCRFALNLLLSWLRKKQAVETFEAVDAQVALDFVADRHGEGDSPSVLFSHVAAFRRLWAFHGQHKAHWINPWTAVRIKRPAPAPERPFTDIEMKSILAAYPAESRMGDLVRIAALTGMRQGEILRIKASDITDNVITIGRSKTRAGLRVVPVSKALQPIMRRLCAARPDGELFDPGPDPSKIFGRGLARLGLSVASGGRRNLTNFHSLRRTVAAQLEHAGVSEIVAARLLGHAVRTLSYGTYNRSGASIEQLREAVERLRLQ